MHSKVLTLFALLVGVALLNSIEARPSPDDKTAAASVPKVASGEEEKSEKDSASKSLAESTGKAIDEIANAITNFVVSVADDLEDAVIEEVVDYIESIVTDAVTSAESFEELVDDVVESLADDAKSAAKVIQNLTDSEERRITEITNFLEGLADYFDNLVSSKSTDKAVAAGPLPVSPVDPVTTTPSVYPIAD